MEIVDGLQNHSKHDKENSDTHIGIPEIERRPPASSYAPSWRTLPGYGYYNMDAFYRKLGKVSKESAVQ
jgi:hypothetical protein